MFFVFLGRKKFSPKKSDFFPQITKAKIRVFFCRFPAKIGVFFCRFLFICRPHMSAFDPALVDYDGVITAHLFYKKYSNSQGFFSYDLTPWGFFFCTHGYNKTPRGLGHYSKPLGVRVLLVKKCELRR